MSTRAGKIQLIQSRTWFHSIEIEPGLVTPGRISLSHLRLMLDYLNFPESFEGLTVLDIGAWDGFFSFEAERRGAKRVVALDLDPPEHTGLGVAKELLQSRVEFIQGSVYELSPEIHGTFDVVFFLGVFYHLRYPLLALDRIREVTKQYVLLETCCMDNGLVLADRTSIPLADVDRRLTEIPLYRFYRYDELNPGDFSNCFSPNRRAVEDALWTAGFRPEFLASWGDRIAFKGIKLSYTPEYLLETYEGLQWVDQPDGTRLRFVPSREEINQPRSQSLATVATPRVRVRDAKEPKEISKDDINLLRSQVNSLQEEISLLHSRMALMRNLLQAIQRGRAYRLMRLLGRWRWFEKGITALRGDSDMGAA